MERELAAFGTHLGSVECALAALADVLVASAADAPVGERTAPAAARTDDDEDARKPYGRLSEQIMAYFSKIGDVDVRARDVAEVLDRDAGSGSIDAVRGALDRLVVSSHIQRAGRGLYRTWRSRDLSVGAGRSA